MCGHCHTSEDESFRRSAHHAAALEGSMEECTSCHDNHLVVAASAELLAGDGEGSCASCHSADGDPGRRVARELADTLGRLDSRLEDAAAALAEAAREGLFLERERGYLDEARGLRVRARPLIHALSPDELDELVRRGEAMIDQTLEGLATKRRALRDRRIFTAAFLVIVLLLAGVLMAQRREIAGGWLRTPTRKRREERTRVA